MQLIFQPLRRAINATTIANSIVPHFGASPTMSYTLTLTKPAHTAARDRARRLETSMLFVRVFLVGGLETLMGRSWVLPARILLISLAAIGAASAFIAGDRAARQRAQRPILAADRKQDSARHRGGLPPLLGFTCPMHPNVQTTEPGDCPLCGMRLTRVYNFSSASNPKGNDGSDVSVTISAALGNRLRY